MKLLRVYTCLMTLILAKQFDCAVLPPTATSTVGPPADLGPNSTRPFGATAGTGTRHASGTDKAATDATRAAPVTSSDSGTSSGSRDQASDSSSSSKLQDSRDDLIGQPTVDVTEIRMPTVAEADASTTSATAVREGARQDVEDTAQQSPPTKVSIVALDNSTEPHCKSNEKTIQDATNCHVLCSTGALFYYSAGRKANGSECIVNTYYVGSKQIESTNPGACFKGKCIVLNVTTTTEATSTSEPPPPPATTIVAITTVSSPTENSSLHSDDTTPAEIAYETTELQEAVAGETQTFPLVDSP